MRNNEVFRIRSLKKDAIICLQMTIFFGIIFILIFQQFSSKGIVYSFIVSGMFSFGLGLGNGFINYYLNTKWDWISQTKQRVTLGIIGTIIYTVPIILGINYITWYVLNDNDPS
ncbi:MAG: histidine kinase, partial [Flavobacteriaceae bacterium]|nr:histidine kinase [Flavobacteriaceae bacterium]